MRQNEQHAHCHHIVLAENEIGNSNICPACAVVNLNLRHLSLRLEPNALRALANLLAQACANLDLLTQAYPDHPAFAPAPATCNNRSGTRKSRVH